MHICRCAVSKVNKTLKHLPEIAYYKIKNSSSVNPLKWTKVNVWWEMFLYINESPQWKNSTWDTVWIPIWPKYVNPEHMYIHIIVHYSVLFLSVKRGSGSIQVTINAEQNELSVHDDSSSISTEQFAIYCSLSYVAHLEIAWKGRDNESESRVVNFPYFVLDNSTRGYSEGLKAQYQEWNRSHNFTTLWRHFFSQEDILCHIDDP